MDLLTNLVFIVLGVVLLFYGSHSLVGGSTLLAKKLGLSPLLIGLTIVAVGTSSPELFVSLYASWQGLNDITLGNVIGSNIVNLGLILGMVVIITPMRANSLGFDILFYSLTLLLLWLFLLSPQDIYLLQGNLDAREGLLFLGLLGLYFTLSYYFSRKSSGEANGAEPMGTRSLGYLFLLILIGLVFLAMGSDMLVRGARYLASVVFGISDKVIGLTLVAIGTSLPELLTSLVAVLKGELELSVGNLLGSCLFNILGVLGASCLLHPITISSNYTFDFWVMVSISLLVIFPCLVFRRLGRVSGFLLVTSYFAYLLYLLKLA